MVLIDGVYQRRWKTSAGFRRRWYVVKDGKALSLKTATWRRLTWWDSQCGQWVRVGPIGAGTALPSEAL